MATTTLDYERLRHGWNDIKAQVRERWGQLSDDDLTIHGGNIPQFLNRLHKVTGEDAAAIESYLSSLLYGSPLPGARYAVEARERLGETASEAARYIRRRPGMTFGSAVCVGFVVGALVGLALHER